MRKSKILIPLMSTIAIGSSLVATVSCGGQNDPDDPIPVTYKVAFDESASKGVEKPELPETIEEKKALDVTFKLKEGYTILTKEGIKVTIGGSSYTDFTFDKSSLKLSIPEGAITGDVTISAIAGEKAIGKVLAEYEPQEGINILSDTAEFYEEFLVEGSRATFWLENTEQAKDKVIYLPLDGDYEVVEDAVYLEIDGDVKKEYNLTCNVDYTYEITSTTFTCILTKAGATKIKNVSSQAKETANIFVKFEVGAGNINVEMNNIWIADLPITTLISKGTSKEYVEQDTISLIDAYKEGFSVRYQAPSLLFSNYTYLNFDLSAGYPVVTMGDPWEGDEVKGLTTDFGTYEDGEYEGIKYIEFIFQPETVWNDIYPWVQYYEQNSEFTFVPNNADGSVATKTPTIDKAEALDILFDDGKFVITMDADEQTSCKYEDDCITEISVGTWTIPNDGTYYSYDVDNEGTKINLTFTEKAYTEFAGKFSSSVNISVKAVWRL